MTPELARSGRVAADRILKSLFGLEPVAKANPLTPSGFDAVVLEALAALKNASRPGEKKAMKAMLQALERQWGGLSEEQRTKAIDEAAKRYLMIARDVAPVIGPVLKGQGSALVVATKHAADKAYKLRIDPSFDAVDEQAVDFAAKSQGNFIRNQYGVRAVALSDVARKVVASGMEQGFDYHEIGKMLGEKLNATDAARSDAYWRFIASTFTARARSYSTLRSFDEAGISSYQWESVLDERTSEICRFMHGKVFPVANALKSFADVEALEDPEDIKDTTPWAGVGKTDDGKSALYFTRGGKRHPIAVVDQSGLGKKDGVGKYSSGLSNAQMSANGMSQPPIHGHCRSILVPVFGNVTPRPEAPPPPPPKAQPPVAPPVNEPPAALPPNLAELVRPLALEGDMETPGDFSPPLSALQAALAKLEAEPPALGWSAKYVKSPLAPVPKDPDGKPALPFPKIHPVNGTNALKKDPVPIPISNIVATSSEGVTVSRSFVADLIKGTVPDSLAKTKPIVVKWEGKFYLTTMKGGASENGAAALVAASHYKGQTTIDAHIIDADALAKKPPKKPKPPKVPAAPPPAAAAPVPAPLPKASEATDASTILHQHTGAPRGSNTGEKNVKAGGAAGGFYTGKDGVKRYVKFYEDPTQAQSEHLANTIYRDLGLEAPESQLFVDPKTGAVGYASRLFEGGKTLQQTGLDKANSKEFMKGFVGDVLTGNWDAIGTGHDNAMLLPGGKVARIDNGGTFLFRAKNGRKPDAVLNQISEWDVFFSSKNEYYSQAANLAGVHGPDDMRDEIRSGVSAVVALRDRSGGWGAYVNKIAPGLDDKDRSAIVKMLEERTKLLQGKVADFDKPKPPAPKPGEARFVAAQYSTTLPRVGLRMEDLPEAPVFEDHYKKIDRYAPKKLPSGENYKDYVERAKKQTAALPHESFHAIGRFGDGDYDEIRASEAKGNPSRQSNEIKKGLDMCTPEPGTVWRGIHGIHPDVVERFLSGDTRFQLGFDKDLGVETDGTASTSWHVDVSVDSFMGGTEDGYRDRYKILYKINGKRQVPIEQLSNTITSEHELLMPRDSVFRITGLSRPTGKKKILLIECEEVVE